MIEELNCRIGLYRKTETVNELFEKETSYTLHKKVWANIIPKNGKEVSLEGGANYGYVTHKITIRSNAVKDLSVSDYFVYREQVFDILYFNRNYKLKDRYEIFCAVREEGD